jgi:hypothetical protein
MEGKIVKKNNSNNKIKKIIRIRTKLEKKLIYNKLRLNDEIENNKTFIKKPRKKKSNNKDQIGIER